MAANHPTTMASHAKDRPLQFSLRSLLVAVSGICIACAILFAMPDFFAVPFVLCLAAVLPAAVTVAAVYGNRNLRAFCIGALFPLATMLLVTSSLLTYVLFDGIIFITESITQYRIWVGSTWVLAVVSGMIGVGVQRILGSWDELE